MGGTKGNLCFLKNFISSKLCLHLLKNSFKLFLMGGGDKGMYVLMTELC